MKKRKGKLFWLIVIVMILLFVFTNKVNPTNRKEHALEDVQTEENQVVIEYTDAEEYYDSHSEVLATYSAMESDQIQTEAQATAYAKERGFGELPIYTEYTMEGVCIDMYEISNTDEQHPIYQISYTSANDELWSIVIMNGTITATNISYLFESETSVQVMISESEVITCYDGPTNQFFEVVPDESSVIVKVVDRIDAAMLDQLTVEVLKEL